MPAYLAMYRAFLRAMESGRIEDATAILEEACFPARLVGFILTDYYAHSNDGRMRTAIRESFSELVR